MHVHTCSRLIEQSRCPHGKVPTRWFFSRQDVGFDEDKLTSARQFAASVNHFASQARDD